MRQSQAAYKPLSTVGNTEGGMTVGGINAPELGAPKNIDGVECTHAHIHVLNTSARSRLDLAANHVVCSQSCCLSIRLLKQVLCGSSGGAAAGAGAGHRGI